MVPMKKMMPITIIAGGQRLHRQGQPAAVGGRTDHPAPGRDQHEQERAPQLAEQPPVLQLRVVELQIPAAHRRAPTGQPRQNRLPAATVCVVRGHSPTAVCS